MDLIVHAHTNKCVLNAFIFLEKRNVPIQYPRLRFNTLSPIMFFYLCDNLDITQRLSVI